jgi:hypothetical protein
MSKKLPSKKKVATKKVAKKRASNYDEKLFIKGTLDDVLKASLKGLD